MNRTIPFFIIIVLLSASCIYQQIQLNKLSKVIQQVQVGLVSAEEDIADKADELNNLYSDIEDNVDRLRRKTSDLEDRVDGLELNGNYRISYENYKKREDEGLRH